jgi:hypothetical protein
MAFTLILFFRRCFGSRKNSREEIALDYLLHLLGQFVARDEDMSASAVMPIRSASAYAGEKEAITFPTCLAIARINPLALRRRNRLPHGSDRQM